MYNSWKGGSGNVGVNQFSDVTKTGNGEWGMGNGEWGMGNGMIPVNGKLKWEFEKKIKKIYFF